MNFLAIDIESTGLSPEKDRIIEIAAIRYIDGKPKERFEKLINPGCPLPERITELTGITEDMLAGAMTEREVIKEFLTFAGEDVLLGHNVSVDFSFIKTAADRLKIGYERQGIDTLYLSRTLKSDLEKKNLESMCEHYGIIRECSHRALEDAIAAATLYQKLYEEFNNNFEALFLPVELKYKVKKQEPMTEKQKKYLLDLVNYHKIEVPSGFTDFSKSKASRFIDKTILHYGRMKK
ncbi:3'-5' exonuclease [Lachnoclostridium phytofermentans]|uniref:DNA polymerase III, epsilon subunit n=1 Tax=Lachnoclostridium phytofermentans (strain ATCC 700394 / DSM 18823 / ISDg) TaxID=357809 RepID=A9KR66_LACP7|nr:3'-5' exonuclease [Lachnoclostridium phytofermentans]ABX40534.1 DNA polymerase III, epsilon subunit [Lachnoclostridium phytofermentans ISDg]